MNEKMLGEMNFSGLKVLPIDIKRIRAGNVTEFTGSRGVQLTLRLCVENHVSHSQYQPIHLTSFIVMFILNSESGGPQEDINGQGTPKSSTSGGE